MSVLNDLTKLRKLDKKKARVKPHTLLSIYKTFGRHYKKYWKTLTVSILSMFATIGVVVLVPWPIKIIIDYIILKEPLPETLLFLQPFIESSPRLMIVYMGIAVILLAVLEAIFSYVNKFWLSSTGERMNADIRERVFTHMQRLSLSFHESSKTGDLVYLMTSDIPKLKDILISFPQDFTKEFLTFATTVVIMMFLDWRLGLIALSSVPFLYLFTWYFGEGMNKAMKQARKKEGEVASIINENITAMALVQAYGREESERARLDRQNQDSMDFKLKTLRLSKTYGRISDVMVIMSTAGVLYFGGKYALGGAILPGTLVVFVSYLREIYGIVSKFSEIFLKLAVSQVSCERLVEMVENDMVVKDSPEALPAPAFRGHLAFEDVHFAYKKGKNVLEKLNFAVSPGETVALIGHSGAGKSTLISLLLRFYDPQRGRIRIDGQDIRQYTLESLREQITILLQEAQLFQTTIRENIAFGRLGATEAEIIEAAKIAEAHDFIMEMPRGYDTKMAEGGKNLSGGQRQRINIARAIIRDKPIVILDEPSTGLDAHSEAMVTAAIRRLTRGRTTFIIAHKFSTIAHADKILLLEEGQLAHMGTHELLMQKSPQYREFYQLQFGSPAQSAADGVPQTADRISSSGDDEEANLPTLPGQQGAVGKS